MAEKTKTRAEQKKEAKQERLKRELEAARQATEDQPVVEQKYKTYLLLRHSVEGKKSGKPDDTAHDEVATYKVGLLLDLAQELGYEILEAGTKGESGGIFTYGYGKG